MSTTYFITNYPNPSYTAYPSNLWPSMVDTSTIENLSRFLDVSVVRQGLLTSNMANIDTPGYRTRDINFRQELDRVQTPLDYAMFSPVVRQVGGLNERPDGNNVNLEREGLLMAETQLRFNAAIQLLRGEFHGLLSAIHEGTTT